MDLSNRCRTPIPPGRRGSCCAHLGPNHPIDRPDLATYSQAEQLAAGHAPSWDSPDIVTNSWGPFRLNPEAQVQVRNLSAVAAAANALVNFSISAFGIGFPRVLVATQKLTLGPNQQATLNFPLAQAILKGDPRTGVFVDIEHPYDAVAINNHGAQVHEGHFTSESGRQFDWPVPLHNESFAAQTFTLELFQDGLTAILPTTSVALPANADATVIVKVQVPAAVHGTSAAWVPCSATLVARRADGSLVGGATRLVRIDD